MVSITISVFGHSLFATCSWHVVSVKRHIHVHVLIYRVATHIFQIIELQQLEIKWDIIKIKKNAKQFRKKNIIVYFF